MNLRQFLPIAALGLVLAQPAVAAGAGVNTGILSCNVSSGWGFVFGSTRDINCTFSPKQGVSFHYAGHISKFGVDIGYVESGVMIWAVLAPTTDVEPTSLAGDYGGVTGGASVGLGLNANVLLGGSNKSISLQPLSIEGEKGLNVAAGIASLNLQYQPQSQ